MEVNDWTPYMRNCMKKKLDILLESDSNNSDYVYLFLNETIKECMNIDSSTKAKTYISYYLLGIGGMTMCCLGLIGNIMSLIVLSGKSMRSSTYSYLSALAVCDLLMLLCSMALLVQDLQDPEQKLIDMHPNKAHSYLFPFIHPAAFIFQVTSVWLTLAFTVDRYIMICHPFEAEPLCTISRARKVIVCLFFGSICFNIPKFFEYKTNVGIDQDNVTTISLVLTEFGESNIFRELYHSWFYIAFVCGIPFLSLAVLNAFLIHAVHQSRQRGREINAAERKRNDTTVMLISVVVVFFICQMPALVSRVVWAFQENPNKSFAKLPLYILNEVGSFLIICNSAINIVPYYFFGRRFRKQFWHIFCHCLLRYKRFQKLTRSFSITVVEGPRRESNGSLQNNRINHHVTLPYIPEVNGNVPTGEAVPMRPLTNSDDMTRVTRKTSTMSTSSDCCYDKSERTKKEAKKDKSSGCVMVDEVNGNCSQEKDPALDCLLERET